jgi:branched-subunit amino acid transport protein
VSRLWTAIVLGGAGTYAMRASFLVVAHRLTRIPPAVDRVLRQIPPAALASIVLPALVRPEGSLDVLQPRLFVGLIAGFVAWRTRNIVLTLTIGIGLLALIEAVT